MFQSSIQQLQTQLKLSSGSEIKYHTNQNDSIYDLQYQLYTKYMELSKQQISVRELLVMNDTQNLIQRLLVNCEKIEQPKESTSTMDSFSYDQELLENSIIVQDYSTIQRRSPKKLTRKGGRGSVLKPIGRTSQQFQAILQQIQRNCSQKTHNVVKSLLSQHKKNLSKIIQIQKKQKSIKKIQQNSQKLQQQNILLKNKLSEIEQKLLKKDEQYKIIKDKLSLIKIMEKQNLCSNVIGMGIASKEKYQLGNNTGFCSNNANNNYSQTSSTINSQLSYPESKNAHPYPYALSTSSYPQNQTLLSHITNKQSVVQSRYAKIQEIQQRIEASIQNAILSNSNQQLCGSKCCSIIKKIKESVMNYRTYLQQQAEQCEKLYNILKEEYDESVMNIGVNIQNQDTRTLMEQKVEYNRI